MKVPKPTMAEVQGALKVIRHLESVMRTDAEPHWDWVGERWCLISEIQHMLCDAIGIAPTTKWDLIIAEARSIRGTNTVVDKYADPVAKESHRSCWLLRPQHHVRLVALNTRVMCEGVDYEICNGAPYFADYKFHDGDVVQMWEWSLLPSSLAFPSYKYWKVKDGELVQVLGVKDFSPKSNP
jgi:hypothetical protein